MSLLCLGRIAKSGGGAHLTRCTAAIYLNHDGYCRRDVLSQTTCPFLLHNLSTTASSGRLTGFTVWLLLFLSDLEPDVSFPPALYLPGQRQRHDALRSAAAAERSPQHPASSPPVPRCWWHWSGRWRAIWCRLRYSRSPTGCCVTSSAWADSVGHSRIHCPAFYTSRAKPIRRWASATST